MQTEIKTYAVFLIFLGSMILNLIFVVSCIRLIVDPIPEESI